ncbi:MAG: hypothetical protein FJ138_08660 [Deltaproteobacteria bacterium]|nr:hypothetical protein [Deltaproteobacteria bacterium]
MSKKKSQARQQRRAGERQARVTRAQEAPTPVDRARERQQERRALRTLAGGALLVALLLAFFGLEVGGETLYRRLAGPAAPAAPAQP